MDNLQLKPNQTILFTGDSITDAGRSERAYRPFGNGYVHFTANYLLAKYPQLNLGVINTGNSGDTVRDLEKRWQRDCLAHQPDVLSVLIGINDIWQWHTAGGSNKEQAIKTYESTYKRLLIAVKQQSDCKIILMEPFLFCDDPQNVLFVHLRDYIKVVHDLAEEFNATLVPLQKRIDEKIKSAASDKWSDDMVHPYVWAHAWISQQWIEAVNI